MEDRAIIQLYHQRNEQAIAESKAKYSAYCQAIAMRILNNREDADEVLNDLWLKAWNAMPPDAPRSLALYLGAITRNLAFDRYKQMRRKKRGNGETELALDEIEAVFASCETPEKAYEQKELSAIINRFLATLRKRDRNILILRYFFVYSTQEIAKSQNMSENHIRTILSRTLKKLRHFLEKEEYL